MTLPLEDIQKIREVTTDQKSLDSLTENINVIMRNSSKLYKLSEDILQVSRIESGTFALHIEPIDLGLMLELAIQDARKKYGMKTSQLT